RQDRRLRRRGTVQGPRVRRRGHPRIGRLPPALQPGGRRTPDLAATGPDRARRREPAAPARRGAVALRPRRRAQGPGAARRLGPHGVDVRRAPHLPRSRPAARRILRQRTEPVRVAFTDGLSEPAMSFWEYLASNYQEVLDAALAHALLVLEGLGLAVLIGVPVAV